jgi:hypothetical protein
MASPTVPRRRVVHTRQVSHGRARARCLAATVERPGAHKCRYRMASPTTVLLLLADVGPARLG